MSNNQENIVDASLNSKAIDFRELSIDGNWVHLADGDKQIDVYVSNFFWRQGVFVNGIKISQKTAYGTHKFNHSGASYELKFKYSSWSDGECRLLKDGELVDSNCYTLYDEDSKRDFGKLVVIHSIFALGLGLSVVIAFSGLSKVFFS